MEGGRTFKELGEAKREKHRWDTREKVRNRRDKHIKPNITLTV